MEYYCNGVCNLSKNILIAFVLNFGSSIFEFIGGLFTNSVAIMSDALHDIGDALSIGLAYILEKKSKRRPDNNYTYGYSRYSLLSAVFTSGVLVLGSLIVIFRAVMRLINPVEINYDGMILFAVIGCLVNLVAAFVTHGGNSLNQKAVNLHMLEDVLGWVVVLIGALLIKYTNIVYIDPVLSICVALFIFINALKSLRVVVSTFLEKSPDNIDVDELMHHISEIDGVKDVHHIHIWSMNGTSANCATLHIVVDDYSVEIKEKVREELAEHNIGHSTIELELVREHCEDVECSLYKEGNDDCGHCHHHHHHH